MFYSFPSEIDSRSNLKSTEHAHSFCRCARSSTFSFLDDILSKYVVGPCRSLNFFAQKLMLLIQTIYTVFFFLENEVADNLLVKQLKYDDNFH